jgi:hypothetical protein
MAYLLLLVGVLFGIAKIVKIFDLAKFNRLIYSNLYKYFCNFLALVWPFARRSPGQEKWRPATTASLLPNNTNRKQVPKGFAISTDAGLF